MKTYFILVLLLLSNVLAAQPRQLNGTIISSASGASLPGASVYLRQSKTSAVSNAKGSFLITMLSEPDSLIISHVGFQTLTVYVADVSRQLTLSMQPVTRQLSDVMISTGYQELSRERATGSFEKVTGEALNKIVSRDIMARLEGTSTLLFDRNANHPSATIRGLSSINGPKEPLIILDNFPYEGNIKNINPNDVESITILKDAAAASIWGSRAGNGVIVITTKKGQFNQPLKLEINVNAQIVEKPDVFYQPVISTGDYIDMEQFLFGKGYYNSQEINVNRTALSPVVEILIKKRNGTITAAQSEEEINLLRLHDVRSDIAKYIYQPALNQQYAVNIKGGSHNVAYLLSTGLDKNVSELSAASRRITLRSENIYKPLKNLQFSAGLTYTQSTGSGGKPSPEVLKQIVWPYTQLAGDAGNPLPLFSDYRQGYIDTAGGGRLRDWKYYPLLDYLESTSGTSLTDVLVNTGIQYSLGAFTASAKYQYERQVSATDILNSKDSYYSRNLINRFSQVNRTTGIVTYGVPNAGIIDKQSAITESNNVRLQLSYNKNWGMHRVAAIAGNEVREVHSTANTYRTYGYNSDMITAANMDYINTYPTYITGARVIIPNNLQFSDKTNRYVSLFTNASYTFKDRYTISASARQDASNFFGVNANNRWNPLWSSGVSWNVSDETFYRSSILPVLELRLTYGFSGNADQSRSAVTTIGYAGSPAAGTNLTYASIQKNANPELRWEKISMLNIAADFETRNKRLSGSIEYYLKKGTDLFGNSPIDYTAGLGVRNLIINAANMKGSGLDIRLSSTNINGLFKWYSTLLFNYNTTRVTRYYLTTSTGAANLSNGNTITALEGKPVYAVLSYQWAGLDSLGNPRGFLDGKPSIDYTALTGAKTQLGDLVYSGPALPPLYGALSNTVSYKGLSLSANITYKLAYYFRKESISYSQLFSTKGGHADFASRWQQPGDELFTDVPSMVYPVNNNRDNFYNASSVLVRNGGHVRLQYVNLEYAPSKKLWKNSPFRTMRLYFSASNLGLLWRANKDGIDPDYGSSTPPAKAFAIGIASSF